MTPLWMLYIRMTYEASFGLTVVLVLLPIHFGYATECVYGIKHASNILNFSTGKQRN